MHLKLSLGLFTESVRGNATPFCEVPLRLRQRFFEALIPN